MILVTVHYQDVDSARYSELLECLCRNTANRWISELWVFVEDASPPARVLASVPSSEQGRVRFVEHGRRATFADLFAFAATFPAPQRFVIANADIFFDATLGLLDGVDLPNQLLCLSRWDETDDGSARFYDQPASQDAWIFDTPLKPFPCSFHLGLPGCDNRLAWEAVKAGIEVSNPSRSIRAHHLHLSCVRRYTQRDRLTGPFLDVSATFFRRPHNPIRALTTLPPDAGQAPMVASCLASWRRAGLEVIAFNHPSDIPALKGLYDVNFVAVDTTSESTFGVPHIPIQRMTEWARQHGVAALVIKAAIELALGPWELNRIRHLTGDGLCYFVRHNYTGDPSLAIPEPHGIDAFLFDGRAVPRLPPSFLSLGQPWWDYWMPDVYRAEHRAIMSVRYPAAFHRAHPTRWSWANWHRCALEFARVTGRACADLSIDACLALSIETREAFDREATSLHATPVSIEQWLTETFGASEPKLFLELGSDTGTDTEWMARLPGVRIHAFEPDPRNHQPPRHGLTVHDAAISDHDGTGSLTPSLARWGQEWTHSSSLLRPKHHLQRYPVTFGEPIDVETVTLDSFCQRERITTIDFIWADIQGAEGHMVRGGLLTLARTHYLYTAYSDDELYEDQVMLDDLLCMLPDFRVVELWPDDVLLENTRFDTRDS